MTITLPRLYVDADLIAGRDVGLSPAQAHYLRNVMRRQRGDGVRVFNGRNGEFLATLSVLEKNVATARIEKQIKQQPTAPHAITLLFAPLKKDRTDFLVEKAVELGVAALQPILTHRTTTRRLNAERMMAQIIEASEQCERMAVPEAYPLQDLTQALADWPRDVPLLWCCERDDVPRTPLMVAEIPERFGFLIGPEGGFDEEEARLILSLPFVQPISLGLHILRAETAALTCLSNVMLRS